VHHVCTRTLPFVCGDDDYLFNVIVMNFVVCAASMFLALRLAWDLRVV
jgi:hypothetical protein